MTELIKRAAELLANAERIVVFTGAGVSRESGLPTFRDAQAGLWAQYSPEDLASLNRFRRNPELVWTWYQQRRAMYRDFAPNPGRCAIAELEDILPAVVVVTQNIDNMHREAGSTDVVELHGNILRYKCLDAGHQLHLDDLPETDEIPPPCPRCGSPIRPDVVWFGELVPERALQRALAESRRCDVMLVVGTSAVVQPAALLPYEAAERGRVIIDVNPQPSGATDLADVFLQGPAGEILPQVVDALRSRLEEFT